MSDLPHNQSTADSDRSPELDEAWFSGAKQGTEHLPSEARVAIDNQKKTRRGRPPSTTPTKQPIKIRLDADLVSHLRESGLGWHTRVNQALRDLVDEGKL